MKVYDPQGNEHDKDPVDARECVKHCGYSYEPVTSDENSEATAANETTPAAKKTAGVK